MSVRMSAARGVLRVTMKPHLKRASYRRLKAHDLPDPPAGLARRHAVDVAEIEGVRVVWLDRERRDEGILVYLHGGAYVYGPQREHWHWFGRLCARAATAGVLVDYKLAPAYAYPVALNEVLAVVGSLGDRKPWFLAGNSAGGGLALAAAFRLRDLSLPLPEAIVLSSPWLDVTTSSREARARQGIDPMLSLRGLARGARPYSVGHDPRDPHISPLHGDPSGLPPMQVHVGTRELLLWESREWARKCRDAGAQCELIEVPGAFHDFSMAVRFLPEARAALERQARFLRGRTATARA